MFERQIRHAGLAEEALMEMVTAIANAPLGGDLIVGTGGARKMRHAGRSHGKSGGYRTVHYYGGDDIPLFLLALVDKGRKANLTGAERNELAAILPQLAAAYRERRRI